MNLVTNAPLWLLIVLAIFLVAAAAEDMIRLRISNPISIGVLGTAVVAAVVAGPMLALWQNLAVFIFFLAAGTFVFAAGKMGGGDVKLLAALGAWVNIQGGLWLLAAVLLAGGVLALGFVSWRIIRRGSSGSVRKGSIPYGIAIVAGAFIIFGAQLAEDKPEPQPQLPYIPLPKLN